MSRDLILVSIAMLTWGVGEGMFFYFQPIYLEQLGADPIAIGTILGGFGVAMTISHIPAGIIADRVGRRPVMLAAWFMGTIAAWVMALADILPVFVVGLLMYGVTMFVLSPLNSYVTTARGSWSVERAITFVSASYNLGAVLGPWMGGQIGEQMGLRQTYVVAAWVFLASTIVILFIKPQPVESPSPDGAALGSLVNRRYMAYIGAVLLAMFALYLPQPLTPNFLQNFRELSLSQIGPLYSITGLGIVALNLLLGQLPAHLGFLLSQLSVGLFGVIIWLGAGLPWYVIGFFLLGGYKTTRALSTAQVRQLVDQSRMGLAYGITETANASGVILAPPLAGLLYTQNPILVYPVSVALILASLLVSHRYSPTQPKIDKHLLISTKRGS